jgi:hypothetical protein
LILFRPCTHKPGPRPRAHLEPGVRSAKRARNRPSARSVLKSARAAPQSFGALWAVGYRSILKRVILNCQTY